MKKQNESKSALFDASGITSSDINRQYFFSKMNLQPESDKRPLKNASYEFKFKLKVVAHRVMDLPAKKPYQWRNEYPTKKPRIRQELVGEIHPAILPPSLAGIVAPGAKPVVFTVKV